MISFIWKNWIRQKEKFILLLIGALFISSGLSFLIGLSETNKGTIIHMLEKKWRASYDIVVLPARSEGKMTDNSLVDPNYLSGISGGISLEEYETIKKIDGISITAPLSVLGYASYSFAMDKIDIKEKGIYKLTNSIIDHDGINDQEMVTSSYFHIGYSPKDSSDIFNQYGLIQFNGTLGNLSRVLIAAIDPDEEAQLVGLDKAIIQDHQSRYFNKKDKVTSTVHPDMGFKTISLPLIMSNHHFVDQTFHYTIEKLPLPFQTVKDAQETFNLIEKKGGIHYLETLKAMHKKTFSFTSAESHQALIENVVFGSNRGINSLESMLLLKTSPLTYKAVDSPFQDRWEKAYEITVPTEESLYSHSYPVYRKPTLYDNDTSKVPRIAPDFIGFYDPAKLNIPLDPTTELPMETYRSPTANLVLDHKKQPINPPTFIKATSNPFGYIMQPPVMLTTLEAAEALLGEKPISSIRIKVDGVEQLNEKSQTKLEDIAKEIEKQTGLKATITLGSSPQPVLIHIPKVNLAPDLGWIEQPWIKTGASISIFKETKLGYSGIIGCLLFVSLMYVFATNLVSFLARKKQFAVLSALGWKTKQMRKMLFIESLLIGSIVSFLTLIVLLIMKIRNPESLSLASLLLIMFFILFIYVSGSFWPCYLISKLQPVQVMKAGEVSITHSRLVRVRGKMGIVINSVFSRWLRNIVSILAISLPSALLILFIFVSIKMDGTLFTSWLGQYVALEVKAPHYISIAIAFVIAILTTAEMMWQNLLERTSEISLYKALGWKDGMIRKLVLLEGAFIGCMSGITGIILALVILKVMYGSVPFHQFWIFGAALVFPILVGTIGAWIPSMKALKIEPNTGLKAG